LFLPSFSLAIPHLQNDVIHPIEITRNVRASTALPQQPRPVLRHGFFVIPFDQKHPVGHRVWICPKGCLASWCPASILIGNQKMSGAEAPMMRERLRLARQYTAQVCPASRLRRKPDGLKIATSPKSA
jgi:hypothetical protein